jgi:acetyl-CoA carboxylase biotin carboxyl carrier protein
MKLTHDDVDRILKLLEASAFDSLDLEIDGLKLSLRRHGGPAALSPAPAPAPGMGTTVGTVASPAPPAPPAGATDVVAPVLGTFYRAPKPGAPAFVELGATVVPDTVVCIVEAMKVMNEIKDETSGVVKRILVNNATPVEYGQPLIELEMK